MATKSLTSSSPPIELDAPLNTILDLWYARNGGRGVHFSYEQIEYTECDDWLMQNMALVVKGIVRGDGVFKAGDQALSMGYTFANRGPFTVMVIFNNMNQDLLVRLTEKTDGDS